MNPKPSTIFPFSFNPNDLLTVLQHGEGQLQTNKGPVFVRTGLNSEGLQSFKFQGCPYSTNVKRTQPLLLHSNLQYSPSPTGNWGVSIPDLVLPSPPKPAIKTAAAPQVWRPAEAKRHPLIELSKEQLLADTSVRFRTCEVKYCKPDLKTDLHQQASFRIAVYVQGLGAGSTIDKYGCKSCTQTLKKKVLGYKIAQIYPYNGTKLKKDKYIERTFDLLLNNGAYGSNLGTILVDYIQNKSEKYQRYLQEQKTKPDEKLKPGHGNVYIRRLALIRPAPPPPPPKPVLPAPLPENTCEAPAISQTFQDFLQPPVAPNFNQYRRGNDFMKATPTTSQKYKRTIAQLIPTVEPADGKTNAAFQYFFSLFGSLSTFTSAVHDMANHKFSFCGRRYGYSTRTAARLIKEGHDPELIYSLGNATSFMRNTCNNSTSSFQSSICAGTRNAHVKHNFYIEGWLSCNILKEAMLMNFRTRTFIPRRMHTRFLSPNQIARLPPPRSSICEMTSYRGYATDFIKAGDFNFDDVVPHGFTATGIPYANFTYKIGDEEYVHHALLNKDESCGKHTMDFFNQEGTRDGPTSLDDLRQDIHNFDENFEVYDTERATSLNPDGPRDRKKNRFESNR